ncbi:PQQ-dependent sugar dehydrogenase [Rugosimonospora africana]|uniref:Glucose/arabinose dehydrogenase n=1 Tax=Rugosimonospora africana TaxID=556532 RepID=A0A8J3VPQ0_9ACTN|nr:PQQ-dependent sugar dehydrogenase [Rugosimonospora africana]GIH14334.1 hypothetical protein Raf01_25060 [Rugosimonospora africana]
MLVRIRGLTVLVTAVLLITGAPAATATAAPATVGAATAVPAADSLLSQGKPVTASSSGGCCPPSYAVDGTTSTRWASGAGVDPQWIYVDLGTAANLSRVVLTWDLSCATAYQVQTSTDHSTWTTVYSTTAGDGGVDDLAVTGRGRYVRMYGTHRCRTDSSKGYSLQEFQVYGNTGAADTQPPTVPTDVTVTVNGCDSATVAWTASTDNVGVAFYDIFHDGQLITSVAGTVTSGGITVVGGVTWGVYVQSRDAAGNVSQASATVTVTPPPCQVDTTAPSAPTGLTGSASGTSVSLRWTAATDNVAVTAYDIYRDGAKAGTVPGTSTAPPATTFLDSGLAANHTYAYYVVARDAAGNTSAHSNQVSVTTGSSCATVCAVTQLATDTDIPWGLVTLPDGTILYSRRDAHDIVHLNPATGAKTTVGTVPNVESTDGEGGLLGLAIGPTFNTDHWLYVFHTSPTDNRIVRFTFANNTIGGEQVLLTGILRNKYHNGGRLRFGPDGKLYAATGDAQNGANAQNLNSLNGKVLRLNPDGSMPSDNPFGNYVWSYGHRNPQGLAFDSEGRLWEQEFGNSVMDETNLITKGGNYGWPNCEGTSSQAGTGCGTSGYLAPKHTYPVADGSCSGIAIIRDVLYVACERGTRLYREVISGSSLTNVQQFFVGTYGRLRTVEPAPDGGMWMTTTNTGDKDSTPNNSNEKILHVDLG